MILSSACRQWRADTHPTIWDEPWSSKLHHVLGHDQACRLLEETEQSVTSIMFASGFQTKSNFNREFRRVTGMSPVDWRDREVWKLVSPNKTATRRTPDDRLKIVGK